MIDFPENEIQTYRFAIRGVYYMVEACEGTHHVFATHDSDYMPNVNSGAWSEVDDTDLEYWIGVVYAYKMTDDTTLNVYDNMDYRIMGSVCARLDTVPEFEELEAIAGYRQGMGESDYVGWDKRADQWARLRMLKFATTNSNCEGAD